MGIVLSEDRPKLSQRFSGTLSILAMRFQYSYELLSDRKKIETVLPAHKQKILTFLKCALSLEHHVYIYMYIYIVSVRAHPIIRKRASGFLSDNLNEVYHAVKIFFIIFNIL